MERFLIKHDGLLTVVLYIDDGIFWANDGSGCGRVNQEMHEWMLHRFGRVFPFTSDSEDWGLDTGSGFPLDLLKIYVRGPESRVFERTDWGWVPKHSIGTYSIEAEEEGGGSWEVYRDSD